jgi:hypothetical protein
LEEGTVDLPAVDFPRVWTGSLDLMNFEV